MSDGNVVDFEYAKAMHALDAPLDTPCEDMGELSPEYSKQIEKALGAALKFEKRIAAFVNEPNASNLFAAKRAFGKVRDITASTLAACAPEWVGEEDGGRRLINPEAAVVYGIIKPRLEPMCAGWERAFALLDAGKTVTVNELWPFKRFDAGDGVVRF